MPSPLPTALEPPALLRDAIARSGLSARQYALTVLVRDERTVRRWLAGYSPIPAPVRAYLARSVPPPPLPDGSARPS